MLLGLGSESCQSVSAKELIAISEKVTKPDFSSIKMSFSGNVRAIISPHSFLLEDGRVIRLNSVECPDFDSFNPSDACINSLEFLRNLAPPKSRVTVYQTKNAKVGRMNRMGEHLGHVTVEHRSGDDKRHVWIQGYMLQEGQYRVRTSPYSPELAQSMYELESVARYSELGIWARKAPSVVSVEQMDGAEEGFMILEGKIKKIARVKNMIYLNFGDDWKTDFTVGVPSKLVRNFSAAGIRLLDADGQNVRVRGWVRQYNGPYVEISHPEQIEFLSGDRQDQKSSAFRGPYSQQSSDAKITDHIAPNGGLIGGIIAQSKQSQTGRGRIVVTPRKTRD